MISTSKVLPKRLALLGSSGRMGQQVIEVLKQAPWKDNFELSLQLNSKSKPENLTGSLDVVLDFSNSKSTLSWVDAVSAKNLSFLICTTGFSSEEFALLSSKLKGQTWAYIPNTSLGIYAFLHCLRALVKFFKDITDIQIHEVHHTKKKDQPSGTALLIQAALADALKDRSYTGQISIISAREGEVIGTHTVVVQRKYDRLILTHEAQDRKLFAEGALLLAERLSFKGPRDTPYSFDELL